MALNLWSTTPSSNDMANYFQTGMRPSAVKTAGWDIMADMAQLWNAFPAGAGTANAQTLANPRPFTTLTNGLTVIYNPSLANTAAATFAPDGLTAKNIFADGAALVGGELQPGIPAILKYDGTQWNLLNPYFSGYGAASGTNTITATVGKAAAYFNGMTVSLKMANTTTGSATLNLNSIGAVNLYYADGVTQLAAGALIQNLIYQFTYDSSLNSGSGGFICNEPSRVTVSFTGTLATGLTTTPTGTVNAAIDTTGKHIDTWVPSAITGTSNAAGMTLTGVPNSLVTATSKRIVIALEDNTANTTIPFYLTTGTANTWTFGGNLAGNAGFTTSGTKGIVAGAACSFSND